jgi:hypothetical protein
MPDISVYEINIDRYRRLARAFGILVVPTLVAGGRTLAGLPTPSDLQNFVLQASSEDGICFGELSLNENTSENHQESSREESAPEDHLFA